jgi:predicted DNA-binding transcriptional regulator AlpA
MLTMQIAPTPTANDSPPSWLGPLLDGLKNELIVPQECRCLSRDQCASALGISVRSLDTLHATNDGPPSFVLGGRRLYVVANLRQWLAERNKTR